MLQQKLGQGFVIQLAVIVFSFVNVLAKINSNFPVGSVRFLTIFGLQICILAAYALFWQQILKRVDLSVAYAHRAMAFVWALVWSALFFGESISAFNLIGSGMILSGILLGAGE